MKHNNTQFISIPAGKEREQRIENLFEEIMIKNFSNLMKEKDIEFQEVQRISNKMDPKRPTPRHIIFKMSKHRDKKRILKATEKGN